MLARGESGRHLPGGKRGHAARAARHAPDRFEDIIALVALYRPGRWPTSRPIARASTAGEAGLYPSQARADAEETFGVIVYQEQVMQIAQILPAIRSGRPTFCAAPWARRSAPRWPRSARSFVKGATERRRARRRRTRSSTAGTFAEYGFNKSHAAAYALVAYQTAYMKANYPVEFWPRR
jgi:DNA polymerase III subunit alpha